MAGYVSEAVIKRLPGYYRHLKELETEGVNQISSQGLGERMQLTASQIRQDINCFGGFGRQGYGYDVSELREHIARILGIDIEHRMAIVGAGNIGRAITLSDSFLNNGFKTVAVFDNDENKIGKVIGGIQVMDVTNASEIIEKENIDVVALAVPAQYAQEMSETLYKNGCRAIWNFAPVDLKLPYDANIVNVHLEEGLQVLSFKMKHGS